MFQAGEAIEARRGGPFFQISGNTTTIKGINNSTTDAGNLPHGWFSVED
jgi:hypothetical protein